MDPQKITTTVLVWALVGALVAALVGAVLSSLWYAVRRNVWPGVETARLPAWARIVQGLVEGITNLPGALRAFAGTPSAPPGAAEAGRPTVPPGLVGVLVLLFLPALLAGCPTVIREPSLEPPANGCDAGATTCHQGAPWRCGPGGRWSQADRRCDRLGTAATAVVCCPTPSALRAGVNVHACVPAAACVAEGALR